MRRSGAVRVLQSRHCSNAGRPSDNQIGTPRSYPLPAPSCVFNTRPRPHRHSHPHPPTCLGAASLARFRSQILARCRRAPQPHPRPIEAAHVGAPPLPCSACRRSSSRRQHLPPPSIPLPPVPPFVALCRRCPWPPAMTHTQPVFNVHTYHNQRATSQTHMNTRISL